MSKANNTRNVLLIEPYYTGSHKQLMDLLYNHLNTCSSGSCNSSYNFEVHLATMPGKKWHWRARTSGLFFAQDIPKTIDFDVIFASSVLPLQDLIALRQDLSAAKKIIYFHENQLVYPVRKEKDRDFQYGYNQIVSCLVADKILFNSKFNMESFLSSLNAFFKLQPDFRPKDLRQRIEAKCQVFYFPICFDHIDSLRGNRAEKLPDEPIRIVWPHRWEFDKNPAMFFRVLYRLVEEGVSNFRLSILGETFKDNPENFAEAKVKLANHLDHFGFLPSKEDYFQVLGKGDIVISTANHEFFGVAMLEAVYCGCFPICPNKLVYPEIFPFSECLYDSEDDLFRKLKSYICSTPVSREKLKSRVKPNYENFNWKNLKQQFMSLLQSGEPIDRLSKNTVTAEQVVDTDKTNYKQNAKPDKLVANSADSDEQTNN